MLQDLLEPELDSVVQDLRTLLENKHSSLGSSIELAVLPRTASLENQVKNLRDCVDKLIVRNNGLVQENTRLRKALLVTTGCALVPLQSKKSTGPPTPLLLDQDQISKRVGPCFVWPPVMIPNSKSSSHFM